MYAGSSHRITDKLIRNTSIAAKRNEIGNGVFHEPTITNLASYTLHKALFLKNVDIIKDIARDCMRLYAHSDKQTENGLFVESLSYPAMSLFMVKLINRDSKVRPFIGTTFRKVVGFLTACRNDSKSRDISHLLSFVDELRTAYNCSPIDDKRLLKTLSDDPNIKAIDIMTRDASTFLYWSTIEVARYCASKENIDNLIDVKDFTKLLDTELSKPVLFCEKIIKHYIVIFLLGLEKVLLHNIETSIRRSSFIKTDATDLRPHEQIILDWLVNDSEKIAKFSLRVNEPAECWRLIGQKLCSDLDLKQKSYNSTHNEIPSKQALVWYFLDANNWRKNLSLITASAVELKDLDLLYGIESLSKDSGIICHLPALDSMISNLEGNFEKTHNDLIHNCEERDEQTLLQFLNACIEIDCLKENASYINMLDSIPKRDLYERYLNSLEETQAPLDTRLKEVKSWLRTWSDCSDHVDINLMIPIYFNTVSKPPQELLAPCHDEAEWLMSQEFLSQNLFPPSIVDSNIKVYNVLFDLLKVNEEERRLPPDLVIKHSKDLYWNHLLLRHICNMKSLDILRRHDENIDVVQYRAIKYHRKSNNILTAMRLSENLMLEGKSSKIKIKCSLSSMSSETTRDKYKEILRDVGLSLLDEQDKNDLRLKIFRRMISSSPEEIDLALNETNDSIDRLHAEHNIDILAALNWQGILGASTDTSRLKTLILLTRKYYEQRENLSHPQKSFNSMFRLNLKLLSLINQSTAATYKSDNVECSLRILQMIRENHHQLDQESYEAFTNPEFLRENIRSWILAKNNLISISSRGYNLPITWRRALLGAIKLIISHQPDILVFNVMMNRLESQFKPGYSIWSPDQANPRDNPNEQESFDLWIELFEIFKANSEGDSVRIKMLQGVEEFLREMRKISFLSNENICTLANNICKKMQRITDHIRRFVDSEGGKLAQVHDQDEFKNRLVSICEHALSQIGTITYSCEGFTSKVLDRSMKSEISINLCKLKESLQRLIELPLSFKSRDSSAELEHQISKINSACAECKRSVGNYSSQLWMQMISPTLSKYESGYVPMPGCKPKKGRPQITIHKFAQPIDLIVSKTSPKRLGIIGSDGILRHFLLKAHEDLRLDELIMNIFSLINDIFLGSKETKDICRLRNFSVTPISSKAGLIEWIEAPAISTIYKDWLSSPSGNRALENFYSSTCRVVCNTATVGAPKSKHINCQMPQYLQLTEVFYQNLWVKAKSLKNNILTDVKPSRENMSKYRAEFDINLFQSVIEQLSDHQPKDLVANCLWSQSINSYSFWRKTKQFTNSCATISMVGYVIGLGDRHLGNILLDYDTGEVIHIDINLCFELAKTLSIPERVPFRLTSNFIRAFGFAGLEGGFTRTSRKVLDLLKRHKSTLLHLLDPINWSFMIIYRDSGDNPKKITGISDSIDSAETQSSLSVGTTKTVEKPPDLLNRSQFHQGDSQSIEFDIKDEEAKSLIRRSQAGSIICNDENGTIALNDLQMNIRTPTKILDITANKMLRRVKDKLSGTDSDLYEIISARASMCRTRTPVSDNLIDLEIVQSTRDQVDALIIEATSMRNKAAMFEGWSSWI